MSVIPALVAIMTGATIREQEQREEERIRNQKPSIPTKSPCRVTRFMLRGSPKKPLYVTIEETGESKTEITRPFYMVITNTNCRFPDKEPGYSSSLVPRLPIELYNLELVKDGDMETKQKDYEYLFDSFKGELVRNFTGDVDQVLISLFTNHQYIV